MARTLRLRGQEFKVHPEPRAGWLLRHNPRVIVGIAIGQRTPGHSTREAVDFERRVNQRYVDHIAAAGWDYLGLYEVEGLVAGTVAEVVVVDARDTAEALQRDADNERELPADIAAFYAECRELFWRRGSVRVWVDPGPNRRLPERGDALRLTVCELGTAGAVNALSWRPGGDAPLPAVRLDVLGPRDPADVSDEVLPEGSPPLPLRPPVGTVLMLVPLITAPQRSAAETVSTERR